MAKNGRFWPFHLVFFYSTVTTSFLMLQNVSYHHTQQYLQTWSAHRCHKRLNNAKNGPKMAKNGCFWPFCLDSSSSTVATTLLVLQNVRYYHLPIFTTKLSYRTDYINIQKSMMPKNKKYQKQYRKIAQKQHRNSKCFPRIVKNFYAYFQSGKNIFKTPLNAHKKKNLMILVTALFFRCISIPD